jgi:hypothetical protein
VALLQKYGQDAIFYENATGGHQRTDPVYRRLESLMELCFFMDKLNLDPNAKPQF